MNNVPLDVKIVPDYFGNDLERVRQYAHPILDFRGPGASLSEVPSFILEPFERNFEGVQVISHHFLRQNTKTRVDPHTDGIMSDGYVLTVPLSEEAFGTRFLNGQEFTLGKSYLLPYWQAPGVDMGVVFPFTKTHWTPPQKGRLVYVARFQIPR